jgi:predicted transporter
MAAPNPFCPNTKGICCLMLLINLGLILVTLGFVVVIQFFEPVFVWYVSNFRAVHTYNQYILD